MRILTNGKPFEIEEQELSSAYFDHSGYLASKLGIVSIPAKVSQIGKKRKPCNCSYTSFLANGDRKGRSTETNSIDHNDPRFYRQFGRVQELAYTGVG